MIRAAQPPTGTNADELLALAERLRTIALSPPAPRVVGRSDVVVRVRIPKRYFRLPRRRRLQLAARVRASVYSWLYQ